MRKLAVALVLTVIAGISAFGQAQNPPTLRVVTDDPRLPSELYYGDLRVKPLRLRPGTNQVITIDDVDFFVSQQYIDFLNRFPEQKGMGDWMGYINGCNGDASCVQSRRIETSSGFFRSQEFFDTGYFVWRLYRATVNAQQRPPVKEFMANARQLNYGVAGDQVTASKLAFAQSWLQRADFQALYPASLSTTDFINKLAQFAGVTLSAPDQQALAGQSRAQILVSIVDNPTVTQREFNAAFVAMQYYGYLRRDPEDKGYGEWLNYLNAHPTDYSTMIYGFIYSPEYRNRF